MTTKPQILTRSLSSVLCFLSSVLYRLSSAERSPDESGARRETIYMQNKPNLNI